MKDEKTLALGAKESYVVKLEFTTFVVKVTGLNLKVLGGFKWSASSSTKLTFVKAINQSHPVPGDTVEYDEPEGGFLGEGKSFSLFQEAYQNHLKLHNVKEKFELVK